MLSCQHLLDAVLSGGQERRALAQEGLGGGPEPFPSLCPGAALWEAVKGKAQSREDDRALATSQVKCCMLTTLQLHCQQRGTHE